MTEEPIKARYQFAFEASADTVPQEITIPAKSSKIISEGNPLGYVTHYDNRHDSIILYLLTLQQGNKTTNHNFKDKKYWILKKKDEQNATYKLIVDTVFFTTK